MLKINGCHYFLVTSSQQEKNFKTMVGN